VNPASEMPLMTISGRFRSLNFMFENPFFSLFQVDRYITAGSK
jgi:hypothetical protein